MVRLLRQDRLGLLEAFHPAFRLREQRGEVYTQGKVVRAGLHGGDGSDHARVHV